MFGYNWWMPRKIHDWATIQRYHDDGHGFVECQRKFGFSHTAWIKAIKRGYLRTAPSLFKDRRRKYDWAEVQAYYDEGFSYRQCQARFGFNALTWHKARLRGEIKTRPQGKPLEQLLRLNGGWRGHVKSRLLRAGVIQNRCDRCGIRDWLGMPISIHIDHINGIRNDHRLENLRMLCPNCHSQTSTYGGRNVKRKKPLQEPPPSV